MSTYTTDKASPFTRAVIASMRRLYPEELADKSFDNTGLLLEAPFDPIRRQMNSVLLTIDLTKAVADEAIERKDCVVVAYHPIIFKGFKALTLADTQQQSLLRLALEGISVYSPHTAVDAAPGGLGDWLADIVTGTLPSPEPATHTADPPKQQHLDPAPEEDESPKEAEEQGEGEEQEQPDDSSKQSTNGTEKQEASTSKAKPPPRPTAALQRTYSKPTYPKSAPPLPDTALNPSSIPHTRRIIRPISETSVIPPKSGMGRLILFETAQPLTHLIERIARGVGTPKGFPVAIPQTSNIEDIKIRSVGICAGSGHDVLADVFVDDHEAHNDHHKGRGRQRARPDLLFTGELSHHQALAATERGQCVITLFHSNTERGFLSSVLKGQLETVLAEEWEKVRKEVGRELEEEDNEGNGGERDEGWEDAVRDEDVLVEVSERDRDPFGIVILQDSEQKGHPLSE